MKFGSFMGSLDISNSHTNRNSVPPTLMKTRKGIENQISSSFLEKDRSHLIFNIPFIISKSNALTRHHPHNLLSCLFFWWSGVYFSILLCYHSHTMWNWRKPPEGTLACGAHWPLTPSGLLTDPVVHVCTECCGVNSLRMGGAVTCTFLQVLSLNELSESLL